MSYPLSAIGLSSSVSNFLNFLNFRGTSEPTHRLPASDLRLFSPSGRLAVWPSRRLTPTPGVGSFGQLDDLGGKIAGDEILEGDPLQHRSHVGPQRDPDLE